MAWPDTIVLTVAAVLLSLGKGSLGKEKDSSRMRFTHHLYNASIYENSAPQTYIESHVKMGIVMTDPFWDIKFSLVAGDDDNLFKTEEVRVGDFCFLRIKTRSSNSASLNREVKDSYTLTIEATESVYDFQSRTKVSIQVLDTNDLKPLFYPASYNVTIREDSPLKSVVVRVSATDADVGSNAEFYYSFTSRAHPYSIDPFTGTVSLIKRLNYSRADRYDLTVLAENRIKKISGFPKFGNVARVIVNVQKVSSTTPVVKLLSFPNPSKESDILTIDVCVETVGKPVNSLSIVGGDPQKWFDIVPSNLQGNAFQLLSTKRINWFQFPYGLNISLQAKDRTNPLYVAPVTDIHIPLTQHLSSLTFLEDSYHVFLSEFSPPKSHVIRVAVQSDSINNVTFQIRNGPDSSHFKINPKTGIIITTEKFDYEKKARYEFEVTANNGEAETHVIVDIIDENDNSPKFTQPSYQASLPEHVPIGSSVLTVSAMDDDRDKNGFVTYAIVKTGPLPFTIDPFTGVISTSEMLDYELMKRWYHLRVWASDSGIPFCHVSECAVTITLSNVNDNAPLFERVGCNASVPMDMPAGSTIAELSAVDLDELQQLRFVIESGNELQLFDINSVSGAVTLAKEIPLDLLKTERPSFTLKVTATDGKHESDPSIVTVTVTKKGTEATINCQETGIFKQLTDKLIESLKPVLTVEEVDSFSDVHIINRHSPKFDAAIPGSIDIREDFPLNSTILHFNASDNDTGFNSKLVYVISSGNEDGCFSIDTFSGNLKVVCPLDRESKEFYILNITVYDLGTPQTSAWKFIAVNVLDVNDNAPLFDQPRYVLHISENTEVGTRVFQAVAKDLDVEENGNILYSLLTSSDLFSIDELTGDVTVNGHLDREVSPRYNMKIQARDQSKADPQLFSMTELVVALADINDNPPKFVPKLYKIKVPEDIPVGTVLVWVESYDLDLGNGSQISYNLKDSENGAFFLDASTGFLTLEKELDFERRQFFNLTVRAVDYGLPQSLSSSCYVEIEVLDVNENLYPPSFSMFVYEASVMEDAEVGTSVLTLTASDRDLGRDGVVRYHIHDGSGLGLFAIDEETGVVRTSAMLDRESVPHYWLSVYARDMGTEQLVSWTHVFLELLDVNDNAPEFSQPIYFASVLENVSKDKSVVKVSATDMDSSSEGKLTFQMLDLQRTYFNIDPKSGVISTVKGLDREDKSEHSIEVIVSDNGSPALSSTATVVIQVLDENDNRPKFTDKLFHVKHVEQRGQDHKQEVSRMIARDDDEGVNAEVTYSLENDRDQRFEIHPSTGVVTSQGDFLSGNYSILTIKATDHGSPPRSSTARLDIEWVTRPTPSSEILSFSEPHFTFAVMETDSVNHMVGFITTETQRLRWFHIIGGNEEQDFDIQVNVGTIVIARRLDAGKLSNYNLTISVTDGHQTVTTQAYIRVVDTNEHRPMFLKSLYEVRVPEDTSPWKDILQISAQDKDSNSKLVYSIHNSLHPDSMKTFHLDPKSGVLVMTEELDYEKLAVHTLIVMVRDQELPMKRSVVKAVIHVEDCNDHSPSFLSPQYKGSISNLATPGTEVLQVKALDEDMGSNAEISYSIHSGNVDSTFAINSELGSISLAKPFPILHPEQYHLLVSATDQGFPQHSDLASVYVTVKLSAYTPPTFLSSQYFAEVSESSCTGTPVVTVSASSPAALHYGIKNGDPNGTFHINAYTGLVSLQKELDFEDDILYELHVQAMTAVGASSETVVYIYVIDENDNAPVFLQKTYLGQISESANINSMVMGENNTPLVMQASDADADSNALLVYQILEPEALKVFKIDSSMGTLSLIAPVDFEAKALYNFSVQIRDSGQPSLYAAEPAKVTVLVLNLNDCAPKFTVPVYESSILFPPVKEMEVVQVTATDADSVVSYSIADGNIQNAFLIHPDTGIIYVSNVSEFKPFYQLLVRASDGLYKETAIVNINVTTIPSSDLEFEQKLYTTNVTENTTTAKTLAVLRATGSHLNEPLVYSLLNPMGRFTISPTSGLFESTGVPFDREEQAVYDVMVEVRDMRHPPRRALTQVKVYIDDINDNAPQFLNLPYSIMMSEESDPGDVWFQVTATDKDLGENGSIMYLLEEDFNLFRIDPYVGDVSLSRPLDFEALNKYVLTVLASDEGSPSWTTTAELSIQVRNRSNPVFQTLLYPLKVPENIPPFTTILHVQARNPEGYRLIYNLEEENATKHFHIDFKTGVLTVTDLLDYESQTMHTLTVRATDSVTGAYSEASIEIEVEDVNDNSPTFSKPMYKVDILEGLPVGTSVLQLTATDRDSGRNKDLTYQILKTEGNETDFFEINTVSGLIVTKQMLDHENTKYFHIKVTATDNGTTPRSSEANVIVNVTDVNDNPPNFSKDYYQTTLDELAKCGQIVIKIQASDADSRDSNNLQYKILSGNEGRYFNINDTSGIISFSNVCKRNLDPFYNLTVAVSDGVFQKIAPVTIDMMNTNRHSPYFKQNIYEAELAENAASGTRVIRLAAIDPDDGPYGSVDYTIINKLADEKFSIDSDGQIVTSQPLDRENPSQRVIAIKVMAKDGGGKVAFCTVKIILTDENDNAPQFKSSEYQVSIQSSVNKGTPVIQIMAYDADDGKNADVTYTVDEAEEVTEDIIEIHPFTGVITVKESPVGLENKIFKFKVKARDGGLPFLNSTVPVQVKVLPPEVSLPTFSEPLYTFSAYEDVPMGTEIGSVKADSDMPLIYSLVNGNTVESNKDKVFTLDKESGTLLVQKSIDHEKTKWYQIDVIAQGNHNGTDVASLVSVSIQVQDVNDNQPVFEADPYQAYLAENMPPGTTVIQITANDPDTDDNGQVTYTLEAQPDDVTDVFTIDDKSGWIVTLQEMDCEVARLYRFHVVATDHGGEAKLSSSALVEVIVTDENDNPPRFLEDVYHTSVMENLSPGEVIVTMTTTDMDVSPENRLIQCYITDGDPLGQFSIEDVGEDKWGLILKEPLDREAKNKYSLKITATDGRFQGQTTVEVHVLDINDNSPLCEQLLYTEVVMENSPSSMFILKISASDPDIGTNGQVSYTLHGPNADKFHLNHKTGELFTLAVLDREKEGEYDLVAKATDGGGRSCQADILLMIQDMNDNAPLFSSSHYQVTVFDNTTVRTPVAVIFANDPDTGINSEVKYSLMDGDRGYFSIDEFSGVLRLEKPFTSDTPPTLELKVKATDRGLPRHLYSVATVTVYVVDLSDYQPVFISSEYTAQVPESILVGAEVLTVSALTRDGTGPEGIVYSIAAGNEDSRFTLHPDTGILTVSQPLDFERCHEYYLSVEGTRAKSSLTDMTMVVINITDVNDNAPVFDKGDYNVEIAEDLSPGSLVMKVTAGDLDGPLNNLVHYSVASGDPQQQFNIDSRSGEITVRTALDREENTHYSLTVQAADEGSPPLSTAVQVTVTISDVNDNPPVFTQINHSLIIQEGEALGSTILQLLVTDRDTARNGPPFSFHVVSGNEDRHFHVDQGGLLSLSGPVKRKVKPQHLLKIQVTDSGHPPLSSICVVKINVTEETKYPPSVVPLEVFITTTGNIFSNRVVGKLHASDQDLHDILYYKLVSEIPSHTFSVDAADGRIWADSDLEPGLYSLNVSVSDGKFSVWTAVKIHVWAANQKALDSGVTLQLSGLSPEEFVADHWKGLQRTLSTALGLDRQDLYLASLQQPNSLVLEALLLWRPQGGAVKPLSTSRLAGVISDIEDTLGLSVVRVSYNGCLGSGCPPKGCRNSVVLSGLNHYATSRAGFITPQHTWESVCPCNESAVGFDGKGYLKYLHQMDEENQGFHLSLRFKTHQPQGVIWTTNSTDWGTLKLTAGELAFRYSCGNVLPSTLHVRSDPVSDGLWHHILLEVNTTALRLTLDQHHTASVALSESCRMIQPHGALLFAGSTSFKGAHLHGFTGCLDRLEFNGEPVRTGDFEEWTGPPSRRVFGVYNCCGMMQGCANSPCLNAGTCDDSNGELSCRCPAQFFGPRCELTNNPCLTQPCVNGGVCIPQNQGFICKCSLQTAGSRCQDSVDACSSNPCPGGYDCKISGGSIYCDPLHQVSPILGSVEIMIIEISASLLGVLLLVGAFVCIRKRYVQKKKKKPVCVQDSNGYFPSNVAKSIMVDNQEGHLEMCTLMGSRTDLGNSPFRSLRPRSQVMDLGSQDGVYSPKTQGPVVCSVAPHFPARPPSNSDNESVMKHNWNADYEVYPADPDYYGRPTAQDFPQFDIVEDSYPPVNTIDSRRNSRFGGFPFPLDRCDRRAPLPPCYSNQNLDDFLGPDGLPLPSSQCPNEYTAISYYPTQHARSMDNVSSGYRRLSMRLSIAQPSYDDGTNPTPAQTRPATLNPHSFNSSDMVESDYGSCEEVMF
ncbi:protocadherin Fat 2 [Osmerus mordax]|uniref:protocadherin Fat 2 n=1 Tax=Osmerus mordax TaxID=8014 RepID=UPI00350EDD5A